MEIKTNNTILIDEIEILEGRDKYIIKQEKDGLKIIKESYESMIIKPLTSRSIKIITNTEKNEN